MERVSDREQLVGTPIPQSSGFRVVWEITLEESDGRLGRRIILFEKVDNVKNFICEPVG